MTRVRIPILMFLFILSLAASTIYVGPSHGDDTFIYMKYVENFLDTGRVYFNVGEKSNGITSIPLFLVMSGVACVFGNTLLVWKTTTALLYAGSVSIAYLAFLASARSRTVALACAAFFGAEPHLLRWSATGMENSLVALGLACALLLHTREDSSKLVSVALGLVMGMMSGIRPEWTIFSTIYIALTFHYRKSFAGETALGFGAALLGVLLLPFLLTGFMLPQTAAAKAIFLAQPMSLQGLSPLPLIIASGSGLSVLVVLFSLGVSRRLDHWCFATMAFVGAVIAYLVATHPLISTRYATSLSLPLLVAALYCISEQTSFRKERHRLFRRSVAAVAAVQVAAVAVTLWYFYPFTRNTEEPSIRAFASKVNGLTGPSDRIALTEIGVFGFYSDRYIIDLLGLVDPQTVRWGQQNGGDRSIEGLESLLRYRKATYYVCAFCASPDDVVGRSMQFEPIYHAMVSRGNGARGRTVTTPTWVLYRLTY